MQRFPSASWNYLLRGGGLFDFLVNFANSARINITLVSRTLRSVAHRLSSLLQAKLCFFWTSRRAHSGCVPPALCPRISVVCSCDHPCFDPRCYWRHFLFVVWTFGCFLVSSKRDRVCIYVLFPTLGFFPRWWEEKYRDSANVGHHVTNRHRFSSYTIV